MWSSNSPPSAILWESYYYASERCPQRLQSSYVTSSSSSSSRTSFRICNLLFCILVLIIYESTECQAAAPISAAFRESFDELQNHLQRYGYLRTEQPSLHEFREALKSFQEVAGVEPTGEVDDATLEAMRRPRCAQEDVHRRSNRNKRFALASQAKWDRRHFTGEHELLLKWHISKYSDNVQMKKPVVRSIVQKAFQLWSSQLNIKMLPHVSIKFEEVNSQAEADINIMWAKKEHGDQYKFDGANGKDTVLAHTFYPSYAFPLNGDIHFDDDEVWITEIDEKAAQQGKRFFPFVLAHEIGHALGLQHSKKSDALMHPYYKQVALDQITLDIDDRCGINWNYVGPSNFCLFVWLMSEIVPMHNKSEMLSDSGHVMRSTSSHRSAHTTKRLLKSIRIPRCSSSNDELQLFAERKLIKNLHFPVDEAKKYSEVVCNFLSGLHVYRGKDEYNPHDSLEKEYYGVNKEVSEFGTASSSSIRRMVRDAWHAHEENLPSVFDADYFNSRFFDNFLPLYLKYAST